MPLIQRCLPACVMIRPCEVGDGDIGGGAEDGGGAVGGAHAAKTCDVVAAAASATDWWKLRKIEKRQELGAKTIDDCVGRCAIVAP